MIDASSGHSGQCVAVARRRGRGWASAGCLVIIVLGFVAYQARWGTWATLHRQADRLDLPAGFDEMHREDEGTASSRATKLACASSIG